MPNKKKTKNIYLNMLYYDDDIEFVDKESGEKEEKELDDNYIDYGGDK